MKKMIRSILSYTVVLMLVTGCGNSNTGHTTQNNNVNDVLNQQIDNAKREAGESTDTESNPTVPTQTFDNVSETEEVEQNKQENSNSAEEDTNVDYDLT